VTAACAAAISAVKKTLKITIHGEFEAQKPYTPAMTKLTVHLLGEPRVSADGGPHIHLTTKKSLALLTYLACPAGVPRARDQLAGLLWGRSAQEQARNSLRQNLARLRKSLGLAKMAIVADSRNLELDVDVVETDVACFEALVREGDMVSLEAASALVRGEFAQGLYVNEDFFDEWLASERRRIAEVAVAALGRLLDEYERRGDSGKTAVTACKLLSFDPLRESAHQSLMRALAAQGRHESALQQYKQCRDLLRRELGIDPGDDTRVLHEEIARRRQIDRHVPHAPAVETTGLIRSLDANPLVGSSADSGLPPQLQGLDLSAPARPSIVILPFRNLTGDEENNHLAEGIRIDIQAALVKITGIFLIAAGSANAMRGQDAETASGALGVRYALKGSIRRAGSTLRISAELIDSEKGSAIWTETFDRLLDDGFEVQDEIIRKVVTALDVKLLRGEQAAVWHRTLKDRDALECFYKGVEEFFKLQKEPLFRARRFFQAVDKKQPAVCVGATWVAMCHWFDAFKAWGNNPASSLEKAGEWAAKAVSMEDADGQAHMVLSHVHLMNRRFDDALVVGREAVRLRPNCTNANGFFANVLHFCGEQKDAIEHVTWAIRYSPVYPPFFADVLALACLFDGSFDGAVAVATESLRLNPGGVTARLVLIAAHAEGGQFAEAREIGERLMVADPYFSVQQFAARQPYRRGKDLDVFVSHLHGAGLPS